MARGQYKHLVVRNHPAARLRFYQGLGYCVEVNDKQLSEYRWSAVQAWSQAYLRPLFK